MIANMVSSKPVDLVEDIWGKLLDSSGGHLPVEESPLFKALLGESVSWKECRLIQLNGGAVDVLFSADPVRDDPCFVGFIPIYDDGGKDDRGSLMPLRKTNRFSSAPNPR
jgi:hypothetical protein